ncbi:MAG TPA: ceramidase domain-containing protein [Paracoccaceae bacterium]|nr:ceramidase domain-containing protein [Paracoccaceae bacterium]HMO70937.1 ceramidase domain-containing protein [Paracoccaceae bacterium]
MDWLAPVDGYCERTGPDYWSEPINALTNLAFLIAAAVVWPRVRGMATGQVLCVILACIGVGSWLFHTHANRLTGLMDVLPIVVFILAYVFVATRDFLGQRAWVAGLAAVGFIPYAIVLTPVFRTLPFFEVSAFYWPVPVLILTYAWLLRRSDPATSAGLAWGAGILMISLTFRSLDYPLCEATAGIGTHFMWHVLNGVMLGWMIEVWRRWKVARGGRPAV